jgi:sugar lactone lactonase YvrE
VYVTEITHNVRKITPAGVVTRLAGFSNGFSMDGTGTSAGFLVPAGITFDSNGNLFVAEGAGRIRRIRLSDLVVTTLAGNGTSTSIDGTGTNATFNSPNGITVDSSGTIYATETNGCRIRKIGTGAVQVPLNRGVVTTFAGSGTAGATNATGTSATFNGPNGVAVDSAGTVYVADSSNHRIRRITPAGVVTTFAGSGSIGATDSSGTSASFNFPYGVAVDSAGVVYVGDTRNHRIRRITSAGVVTTLAGSLSNTSGFADGTGTSARFFEPQAVAVDSSGTVYVADTYNHRIRRITPAGVVTTLAGSGIGAGGPGTFSDGSGTSAGFNFPNGVAVDSAGTVYVADSSNHRIRRITPAGVVTTLAGSTVGSSDGTGTNASFSGPVVLAVDSSGSVYVCEVNNNRIRKITPAGVVTTLAGSTSGFLDGTGTNALFNEPRGIAVDSGGILYVADYLNHRIRKVQ